MHFDVKKSAPMLALQRMKDKYPTAFKELDRIYTDHDAKWHKDWCYCPVALGLAYVSEGQKLSPKSAIQYIPDGSRLAVLSSWRYAKSIYNFDTDLARELFTQSQKGDFDVTSDFLTLPYFCVYLRVGGLLEDANVDGFFVMFDDDVTRKHKELYVMTARNDGTLNAPSYLVLPPEGRAKKFSVIIAEENAETSGYISEEGIEAPQDVQDEIEFGEQTTLRWVINMLLYISASNADIRMVNRKSLKRLPKIKDVPREVASYDVGEETGYHIRQLHAAARYVGAEQPTPGQGHHKSPVMHIRRAHYHTYHYGKSKKQKRLKWLAPMIINGNGDEIDYVNIIQTHKEDNSAKSESGQKPKRT